MLIQNLLKEFEQGSDSGGFSSAGFNPLVLLRPLHQPPLSSIDLGRSVWKRFTMNVYDYTSLSERTSLSGCELTR